MHNGTNERLFLYGGNDSVDASINCTEQTVLEVRRVRLGASALVRRLGCHVEGVDGAGARDDEEGQHRVHTPTVETTRVHTQDESTIYKVCIFRYSYGKRRSESNAKHIPKDHRLCDHGRPRHYCTSPLPVPHVITHKHAHIHIYTYTRICSTAITYPLIISCVTTPVMAAEKRRKVTTTTGIHILCRLRNPSNATIMRPRCKTLYRHAVHAPATKTESDGHELVKRDAGPMLCATKGP